MQSMALKPGLNLGNSGLALAPQRLASGVWRLAHPPRRSQNQPYSDDKLSQAALAWCNL